MHMMLIRVRNIVGSWALVMLGLMVVFLNAFVWIVTFLLEPLDFGGCPVRWICEFSRPDFISHLSFRIEVMIGFVVMVWLVSRFARWVLKSRVAGRAA
jgi:hypothetical protein